MPMGEYTMYTASQIPHIVRTTQAITCGIAEAKLRVVAPDVGGGFGSKLDTYAEESICLALARRLNRPIKWTEERSEGYVATIHGRDLYTDMEMAATRDGDLKAVRVTADCGVGAYHRIVTPGIQMLAAWLYGGLYDVEGYDFEYTNVYTTRRPPTPTAGPGGPRRRTPSSARWTCWRASWGWTRPSCGARTTSRPTASPTTPSRAG